MLVHDLKGRTAALFVAMAVMVTALPLAHAATAPAPQAEATEAKKPKKAKKKSPAPAKEEAQPEEAQPEEAQPEEAQPEEAQPEEVSSLDTALAVAFDQIGKPYRYGASGPSAFDCSGFVRYVFAAAGISLPRSSRAQLAATPRVPLSELQRGDLVFSPGHVGIYLGEGEMIHSPRSGDRVKVAPLHSRAYTGGRVAA